MQRGLLLTSLLIASQVATDGSRADSGSGMRADIGHTIEPKAVVDATSRVELGCRIHEFGESSVDTIRAGNVIAVSLSSVGITPHDIEDLRRFCTGYAGAWHAHMYVSEEQFAHADWLLFHGVLSQSCQKPRWCAS